MDRAVKIWPFRPDDPERIKREDKPFFSSSKIHKARVLSVNWYACFTFDHMSLDSSAHQNGTKQVIQ